MSSPCWRMPIDPVAVSKELEIKYGFDRPYKWPQAVVPGAIFRYIS